MSIDLGEVKPDVGYLGYVPRYVANLGPSSEGAITSYRVLVSTDGESFNATASGDWAGGGRMKSVWFGPVPARFVRLEAVAVQGGAAAATEISAGANRSE